MFDRAQLEASPAGLQHGSVNMSVVMPPFPTSQAWADLSTLALAGGGNRCWWQAGAISRRLEAGWPLPKQWVGTSAGAAIAAACLTTGPGAALAACRELYGQTNRIFDWRGMRRGRLKFAHQSVYPSVARRLRKRENLRSIAYLWSVSTGSGHTPFATTRLGWQRRAWNSRLYGGQEDLAQHPPTHT